MHSHTINWLRNAEIAADQQMAEKRWATATKLLGDLGPNDVTMILRAFLFSPVDQTISSALIDKILRHDPEFRVSDAEGPLRAMCGITMAASFSTANRSSLGNAFALGLASAQLGKNRGEPAIPPILEVAENYLLQRALVERPDDFETDLSRYREKLFKKVEALDEAAAGEDVEKTARAKRALYTAIADQALARRVRQLAEETQVLWLLVGQYSPTLKAHFNSLKASSYALVLAREIADRIQVIPPPPSVEQVFSRSLGLTQDFDSPLTLATALAETDSIWLTAQSSLQVAKSVLPLVPFTTAIAKLAETGDANAAVQSSIHICGHLKADRMFTPFQIAQQYFVERCFLRALDKIKELA